MIIDILIVSAMLAVILRAISLIIADMVMVSILSLEAILGKH